MKEENIECVTLKELASFRWFSLGGALRAIAECYSVLYVTLEHDASKVCTESKGILTKMNCNPGSFCQTGVLSSCLQYPSESCATVDVYTGFIQASRSKIQGLSKDF